MLKFLHRFFNPHCQHCLDIEREQRVCLSCETLRTQLAECNYEKKQLLNRILNPNVPIVQAVGPEPELHSVPLTGKNLNWPARRANLEEGSRLRRLELDKEEQIRKELDRKNSELEKEVLGEENHA